jgi:hypothetical protein
MKSLRAFVSGVFLFAIVLVGVLGIVWATSAQYQAAPEADYAVANEAITADVGNWTPVDAPDHAQRFYDNETVTNSSGAQLTEGTDYEWNTSTGELRWYDTDSVADGEEMSVDYTYSAKTDRARTARSVLRVPVETILPAGVLIIAAMSLVGLAAGTLGLYRSLTNGSGGASQPFSRR